MVDPIHADLEQEHLLPSSLSERNRCLKSAQHLVDRGDSPFFDENGQLAKDENEGKR